MRGLCAFFLLISGAFIHPWAVFDPAGWQGYNPITIKEAQGLERSLEPVDAEFKINTTKDFRDSAELRIVRDSSGALEEVPAQFYQLKRTGNILAGRVVFYTGAPAAGKSAYRLYFGNPHAAAPRYHSGFTLKQGPEGPRHYFLENEYYRLETMPRSGQVWHIWNKKGSNATWYFNEWKSNKDKGGDPVHWAPNCWLAYPERNAEQKRDWHYVLGWENPETEMIRGPLLIQIKRRGVVRPHPEHTDTTQWRDKSDLIHAEILYRFYDRLPWYYESSTLRVLKDIQVYFIRNNQMVFKTEIFNHMFIRPVTPGILPGDEEEAALFPLMGHYNRKPYDIEHTLSNVLPSKLDYYGYFNDSTGDGFANFQIAENNTNIYSGKPAYFNHATIFTEAYGWATYCARTFSYTNQRFNPENAVLVPKGEEYQEENIYMIYKYQDLKTLDSLKALNARLKHPLIVEVR